MKSFLSSKKHTGTVSKIFQKSRKDNQMQYCGANPSIFLNDWKRLSGPDTLK
jgi:hypothetical protein